MATITGQGGALPLLTAVDINCDLGESYGRYVLGRDDEVIRWISSANVACGFHAGDPHVMRRTVELARAHGVAVGAHPGLPDLLGFGRRPMAVSPGELRDYFTYQIGALRAFTEAAGLRLQHVKMHGALFEMALADRALADAMAAATLEADPELIWLCPAGAAAAAAREQGLRVAEEFYADRAYHADLRLVSRRLPGAVLADPGAIEQRLREAFSEGRVTTVDGVRVPVVFQSVCVHGDTPGAAEIARRIRQTAEGAGVAVRPLAAIAG